ncbi:spermidine synthase [Glycomyces buryatensis]|uniref:Spermidine synthase n=1 Tax=Glycomyces buryatensis TaxID=2570927 RepID=A0A4V4HRP3_9ACTN|nr:spermidine synthase [Glycomyces buryatensis]THV38666.1 spermidine synthase [Glycomyces buryatensis]
MTRFEELDWQSTPMGEISLRRRFEPVAQVDVYEVKLDDEFLMSSLFPVAEIELARLGMERATGKDLSVLVGGLGLGYTAFEALASDKTGELVVCEYSEAVISWHEQDLLPDTHGLAADPRTRLIQGDFFAAAAGRSAFDPEAPNRQFDVVLLDIDHSPRFLLNSAHASFYNQEGLEEMSDHISDGGVFALWSDDPPDEDFMAVLEEVFVDVEAHRIWFDNPLTGGKASNTVYLGSMP